MARNFNGAASITLSTGGLGSFQFGTMVALARRTDNNNWHGIVTTIQAGGGSNEVYLDIAPSSHASAGAIWSSYGSIDNSGTLKFLAADGWCIVGVSKATGSQTPRYHKYVVSSATWTHQAGGGAIADGLATTTGTEMIGNVGGDFFTGDIAAVALFNRVLADQEIESLAGSWETWLSYQPVGAWLLDSDTAVNLIDWTGGGANQSAVTGTSVQAASVPAWNQSDGGWPATVAPAAGGTDATVTPTTVAAVAAVPAPALDTGQVVTASPVAAVAAVPAPALQLSTSVTVAAVTAVAGVGTATLSTGEVAAASTVAAVGGVGTATIGASTTVQPSTVAAVGGVGIPALHTGETASPSTVAAVGGVGAPSIATGGSTTVSAATVAAVAVIAAAGLSTGERVTAGTVPAVAAVPAVTVQISIAVAAATVAATGAVGAASLAAGQTAAAVAVAALAAVPAPTIAATAAALVGSLTASSQPASNLTSGSTRTGGPT